MNSLWKSLRQASTLLPQWSPAIPFPGRGPNASLIYAHAIYVFKMVAWVKLTAEFDLLFPA